MSPAGTRCRAKRCPAGGDRCEFPSAACRPHTLGFASHKKEAPHTPASPPASRRTASAPPHQRGHRQDLKAKRRLDCGAERQKPDKKGKPLPAHAFADAPVVWRIPKRGQTTRSHSDVCPSWIAPSSPALRPPHPLLPFSPFLFQSMKAVVHPVRGPPAEPPTSNFPAGAWPDAATAERSSFCPSES